MLWLAMIVLNWPLTVSFEDEVGYVGEARLLLQGRLRPLPESPGIWTETDQGRVSKYPLLMSVLVAPLFMINPRLVFVSGVAAALGLTFTVAHILQRWGRSPTWALIILAHPTVVILARTVMADLLLALLSVMAWWSLRHHHWRASMVSLLLMVPMKATGSLVAAALVAGEAIRCAARLRRLERPILIGLSYAIAGIMAGTVLTGLFNLLTTGNLWFAYGVAHRFIGTPVFWPRYFSTTAPVHLRWLLLVPPALLAGAWPLWRRREVGPLLVIFGFGFLMCFYFFVDHGRTPLETLILSPRLLLPAAVFLLIGYADLLATLASRFSQWSVKLIGAVGIVVLAAGAFAISRRHHDVQASGAAALSLALRRADETGAAELGLTDAAVKAGILAPVRVTMVGTAPADKQPDVVLCSTQSSSYRSPGAGLPCSRPGYRERERRGGFTVLIKADP